MIELNEEQRIILENVKKVAREQIAPIASEIDREGVFRLEKQRINLDSEEATQQRLFWRMSGFVKKIGSGEKGRGFSLP